jgi:hypothetical protein
MLFMDLGSTKVGVSFRHSISLLVKAALAFAGLVLLALAGIVVFLKLNSRPLGTPLPGFEDRMKYKHGNISNFSGFDNIPVDLWFGKRNGIYDTTNLRIASDYLTNIPNYHGEYATIRLIWPSLRSADEEREIRKKQGLPAVSHGEDFKIILSETGPGFWGTDKDGTAPVTRCEPIVRDERRGVKLCNENRFDDTPGKRRTNYWPIDETFLTPVYKNPPRFACYYANVPGERVEMCNCNFSINEDVHVEMFINESLAVKVAADFPKLVNFLVALEVQP